MPNGDTYRAGGAYVPGHFLYLGHRVDVTIVKRGTLNSGVEGLNMRSAFGVLAAILTMAAAPVAAAAPASSEQILAQAERYTVKVKRISSIGLNQDEGGSAHGTGFLIDRQRGWILTNAHVASRSPAELTVSFKGQRPVEAKRVYVDPLVDMAIMAIDPKLIPATATAADLDCSGELPRIGTPVAIFGHPGTLSYAATRGIISSIPWIFPSEVIQSDAIINGGNSGGPLISLSSGKVVGLAAARYRDTADEHSTPTSLSILMPDVCPVVELLKAGRNAGLRQLPVAWATAEDDFRPIVATVYDKRSPLQIGDLILGVNGRDGVRNISDLLTRLRGSEGDVVLTVQRGGKRFDLTTRTVQVPDLLANRAIDLSGLIIAEQWKLDRAEFAHESYLVIDFVKSDSPGAMTDAQASNHIVAVNNKSFTSLQSLFEYFEGLSATDDVTLIIKTPSSEAPFYRQYLQVTVPRGELKWLTVQ